MDICKSDFFFGDSDSFTAFNIGNATFANSTGNGVFNLFFVALNETLSINSAFVFMIFAAVNELSHSQHLLLGRFPDAQIPFRQQADLFFGVAFGFHAGDEFFVFFSVLIGAFYIEGYYGKEIFGV